MDWLPLLLALASPLILAVLIARYGVESLHWDEWGCEAPMLKAYLSGSLDWTALSAQCNESRPVFPKLIWLALTLVSGAADPRWEMFMGWLIVALTAWNVFALARRTLSLRDALWMSAGVNALLFSPSQHENWLWGAQMMLFLPALFLTSWLRVAWSAWPERTRALAGAALAVRIAASGEKCTVFYSRAYLAGGLF
ncbi:hypothetical protein G7B40_041990 [Aetokthonos hydrillicola Thurmond2011]|uniref:Uncharacterized protein n=1 Tax=Aetokthonos hydrillicola Thurmond2011 TaxID=2712845 RepID=A0AAP5IG30_9CYAN|nr:hypothetical protein [Aetokthonos hydrillicola]MDR9900976.1 hypothetical protein [Aetokthonos hydrillicola Thurmond2011]